MFHRKYLQMFKDYADRTQDDISYLRAQVRGLQERNDRLVEALARKEGVPLQLPIEPYSPVPVPEVAGPTTDTGLNAWWAAVGGSPKVATPVKEEKVAPNS